MWMLVTPWVMSLPRQLVFAHADGFGEGADGDGHLDRDAALAGLGALLFLFLLGPAMAQARLVVDFKDAEGLDAAQIDLRTAAGFARLLAGVAFVAAGIAAGHLTGPACLLVLAAFLVLVLRDHFAWNPGHGNLAGLLMTGDKVEDVGVAALVSQLMGNLHELFGSGRRGGFLGVGPGFGGWGRGGSGDAAGAAMAWWRRRAIAALAIAGRRGGAAARASSRTSLVQVADAATGALLARGGGNGRPDGWPWRLARSPACDCRRFRSARRGGYFAGLCRGAGIAGFFRGRGAGLLGRLGVGDRLPVLDGWSRLGGRRRG